MTVLPKIIWLITCSKRRTRELRLTLLVRVGGHVGVIEPSHPPMLAHGRAFHFNTVLLVNRSLVQLPPRRSRESKKRKKEKKEKEKTKQRRKKEKKQRKKREKRKRKMKEVSSTGK